MNITAVSLILSESKVMKHFFFFFVPSRASVKEKKEREKYICSQKLSFRIMGKERDRSSSRVKQLYKQFDFNKKISGIWLQLLNPMKHSGGQGFFLVCMLVCGCVCVFGKFVHAPVGLFSNVIFSDCHQSWYAAQSWLPSFQSTRGNGSGVPRNFLIIF